MALIDDWIAYVEDPTRFSMSHFESLIETLETEEALHQAFDRLPGGSHFVAGLVAFRARTDGTGVYRQPKAVEVRSEDLDLASAYRDNMVDRLRDLGDPEAALIRDAPLEQIAQAEYKQLSAEGSLPLLDAPMGIAQDFIIATKGAPKWIRGLYEAVYMMTTIPEVSRWLVSPVVTYPLDDAPAGELWLRGHRMDFCEDRTLLIVGGA
ncbi:MAG: hypothetical protein AAFY65_15470 [Pseudomonadota bacterium]